MNFGFSEEQEMIRKSARDFVKGQSSFERLRELIDDPRGYSPQLYKLMADSGWLGTVYPENCGGMGLGYVDLLCIQEELGKGLIPEPLMSSAIMGGNAIFFSGDDKLKSELLPKVVAGETILTLAAYELAGRFNFAHVETTAKAEGDGFILNGTKCFVPDAASADKIVVSARTGGAVADTNGITLFLLDPKSAGVTLTPIKTIDRRQRSTLDLKNVKVGKDAVIGKVGEGYSALDQTIDRATLALCAEMLGGMEQALNMSVAYSKERVQFGKPIGSFQSIKHKCANMYVALETARSATYYATMAVDENMPDMRSAISCAKALCSDAYIQIGKDAIQVFGGIGFTHECDVQFFYKRAVVANATFGDSTYHRDRYAAEKGF
ncbi:acyl-CoA dehydrogenase family protein [Candidatus Sumerlaeota bacterium]|nr:acyl-CoA dehydrogenase family protein [Candidatus Sumerlaeota bacterium]MBI3736556.1 acyl-CoA dehydrogenase family protein [Candidatus Sumerlaeota bacterium]